MQKTNTEDDMRCFLLTFWAENLNNVNCMLYGIYWREDLLEATQKLELNKPGEVTLITPGLIISVLLSYYLSFIVVISRRKTDDDIMNYIYYYSFQLQK